MANELVVFDSKKYPALTGSVAAMLSGNLAGEELSPSDLNRIRCPSAGGSMWTIPSSKGEQAVAEFNGVIIHISKRRAYWSSKDPSGDPPDCSSSDGFRGVGCPGGECAHCPLNAFGSATKPDGTAGKGKACNETRLVFVLREGGTLPDVVVIPPASLKIFKKFRMNLDAPFYQVLTRFTLHPTKNTAGVKYTEIVPIAGNIIPDDEAGKILAYAKALESVFAGVSSEQGESGGEF